MTPQTELEACMHSIVEITDLQSKAWFCQTGLLAIWGTSFMSAGIY